MLRVDAVISAQDKLRPGLSSAARRLETFRRQQSKLTAALGPARMLEASTTRLVGASRRLVAAAAPLVSGYAAIQAVKRYADVDRAMTRVGITGDATAEEVTRGTKALRDMAVDTATPLDRLREGMEAITASGRSFADSMAMMPSVARTAQASGSEVKEIADSSVALIDHLGISIERLGEAQDILAKGGKVGKFELKDMARYLPMLLPAYRAVGAQGEEGLRKLVAMLEVIRAGAGTSEEAANAASNIFQKMESEQTLKNFSKAGVDLEGAFKKARKEGKDLLSVFFDMSHKALKGDISNVPKLFSDMQVALGMRALMSMRGKIGEYEEALRSASGTVAEDFKRVVGDQRGELDKMSEGFDRLTTSVGRNASAFSKWSGLGDHISNALQKQAKDLEDLAEKGPAKVFSEYRQELAQKYGRRGIVPLPPDDIGLPEEYKSGTVQGGPRRESAMNADYRKRFDPKRPWGLAPLTDAKTRMVGKGKSRKQITTDSNSGARAGVYVIKTPQKPDIGQIEVPVVPLDDASPTAMQQFHTEPATDFTRQLGTGVDAAGKSFVTLTDSISSFEQRLSGAKHATDSLTTSLQGIESASFSGATAGASFADGLVRELQRAESQIGPIIERIKAMLSFTATPRIGAPSLGNPSGLNKGRSMGELNP